MTDPYKVLGVSPHATDDEVKDAYRRLARKYHPDNYVNNPLSDLATEKMKEINEAYDEIQRQRKGGGSGYGQQSYGGYQQGYGGYRQQSYGGSGQFADIRRLINLNRLADAEELVTLAIHPYTRSLLSAIPMPNPRLERKKKLLVYDPAMHDYTAAPPAWRELRPRHWVLCNDAEAEKWLAGSGTI